MRKLLMFGVLLALRTAVIFAQGSPIVTQQYGNGLGGGVHTYLIASTPADDGGDYDHLHLVTTFNCNDYAGCNSTLDATFGNRGGFLGVYTVKGAYSAQANVRLVAYRDSSSVTYIYLILADYYDLVTYTVLESIDDSVYPNPTDLGDVTPPGTLVFDTSNPAYPPANYTDFAGDFVTTGEIGVGTTSPQSKLDVTGSVATDVTGTEDEFHLTRLINDGISFPQVAAFHLGTWNASGVCCGPQTRLDINLKANPDGNLTGDTNVMSLLSNGSVGIGMSSPGADLPGNMAGRTNFEVNGNMAFKQVPGGTAAGGGSIIFSDGTIQSTAASNSISGNSLPSNVVSSSLTSVGTVTSGVWNASPLTPAYLPSDLDYIDQAQTISSKKTFTGGVSVSMGGLGTPFTVQGAALGNTSGNTTALMTLQNSDANANYLSFSQYRNATGSYWNTATTRIQTVTDVTAQGYIDFNPPNGQYGLAMGSGSSEYFRIAAGGNVGIGTTNPGAMLDVAGNVKISGSGASLTFPDGTVQSTAYVGTTCSTGAEQLGPATAPSGSCSTNGAWAFSQDGHATFCASGTWATKI